MGQNQLGAGTHIVRPRVIALAAALCLLSLSVSAQISQSLNIASALEAQESPQAVRETLQSGPVAPAPTESLPPSLQLAQTLTLAAKPVEIIARPGPLHSIVNFAYWFAVLMLASLTARNALRRIWHLMVRPPRPRSNIPHARWPALTVVFETQDAERLRTTLAAIGQADYPAALVRVIALCPVQDPSIQTVLASAHSDMPERLFAMTVQQGGDLASRCFAAGLRHGRGDIVITLPDNEACSPQALKTCAEHFFDPALGALLGFIPGGVLVSRALTPRLAAMMRSASQIAGIAPARGLVPGTGLLAVRRGAVKTAGIDPARFGDALLLLRRLELTGSRHCLVATVPAAGECVEDWTSRSHWIARRAQVFVACLSANPMHLLYRWRSQAVFGAPLADIGLAALWCLVALGSAISYFAGHANMAGIGMLVCAATAYGLEGIPIAVTDAALLLRVHGRRADTQLIALAPVIYCHDLAVSMRNTLPGFIGRARRASDQKEAFSSLALPSAPIANSIGNPDSSGWPGAAS